MTMIQYVITYIRFMIIQHSEITKLDLPFAFASWILRTGKGTRLTTAFLITIP